MTSPQSPGRGKLVTDEMVERAAEALAAWEDTVWADATNRVKDSIREAARGAARPARVRSVATAEMVDADVLQRHFRTLAYVRFSSAAHRLGDAHRAARSRPSAAAEVARADALTSLRDCRVAFIAACGYRTEDIDPRTDLVCEAARAIDPPSRRTA